MIYLTLHCRCQNTVFIVKVGAGGDISNTALSLQEHCVLEGGGVGGVLGIPNTALYSVYCKLGWGGDTNHCTVTARTQSVYCKCFNSEGQSHKTV